MQGGAYGGVPNGAQAGAHGGVPIGGVPGEVPRGAHGGVPSGAEGGVQPGEFQVLRMLRTERSKPPGGHVTYLAQISGISDDGNWVSAAKAAVGSSASRAGVVKRRGRQGRKEPGGGGDAKSDEGGRSEVSRERDGAGRSERAPERDGVARSERAPERDGVASEKGWERDEGRALDEAGGAEHRERAEEHDGGGVALEGPGWRKALRPVSSYVDLGPHPKRPPYAGIGGAHASVTWARTVLGNRVTAHQERTWNLSAIWRLDDMRGRPVAWLKQVPKFFAHEAEAIRLVSKVAPALVPYVVVAGEEGRILMRHVPGEDRYGAGAELRERVLEAVHPVQSAFVRFLTDEDRRRTIEATVPDGRLDADRYARVAAPFFSAIPGLKALIDDLPSRIADVRDCGVPDTLVHGDLHVGNVRTDDDGGLTIVDWADCFIGHPGFDLLRIVGGLDDPDPLISRWTARWRETAPGSDPRRALRLLRPIAPLRDAVTYAAFLDAIEPSEWPYHTSDVPAALARAASMVG